MGVEFNFFILLVLGNLFCWSRFKYFHQLDIIESYNSISIFYLFFIIIINTTIFDTFAYLFGSNFGKTSIAPNISPNKTLEGLIGGLVVVFIYASQYAIF